MSMQVKEHHHCAVVDSEGRRLLSRRVLNDEAVLQKLIADVGDLVAGGQITWAVDLNAGGAALLIALLVGAEQRLLYLSGRQVNRASGMYRGEGKTDARDAAIIADQARIRVILACCALVMRSRWTCGPGSPPHRSDMRSNPGNQPAAGAAAGDFPVVCWYNAEHRHSGIAYHTPGTVHYGQHQTIHAICADVLTAAYTRNPERFVRKHPQPATHPARSRLDQQASRRRAGLRNSLDHLPKKS